MTYSIQQKHIRSFDGTRIGYQIIGKGKLPFVLCNGLGGSAVAWSPIYNKFGDKFKFIIWDYRGLFTSDKPEDMANLSIADHAQDLAEVLKAEKITKAIFGGWSMGVQVALEFHRRHAKMYQGLFLINGTFGSPLNNALNSRLTKYIVPYVNQLLKKSLPTLQPTLRPIAKQVIDRDEFISIVTKIGLIHKNLDSRLFRAVAQGMIENDLSMFHHILDHLAEHDAKDVLPKIKVPTLIIASTRDLMTPSESAEKMSEIIPNSQLFILSNASHYSLLEFPDIINARLNQFLNENFL